MKTIDARSLSPETQENIRINAVKAVHNGMKQVEAANIFGVTRQAIGKWYKAFKENGLKALKAKPQGKPKSQGKLKPWQCAQIAKSVIDHTPDQLKLPFTLWTREAVTTLIKKRFGISLSKWTVGRYLKKWGFTPQKPLKKAYEQNPVTVEKWLKEEYPSIKERAVKEKAIIYWSDEMGLYSEHIGGRTYGKRGETPVINMTGKRFKCNTISALTNQGKLFFMVFKDRFNWKVFVKFIKRLIKSNTNKIFLIIDNYSVHKCKDIKKFVDEHKEEIELFFLPTYSPDLNPTELVNHDVKANVFKKERPNNQYNLVKLARNYLSHIQHSPQKIINYFKKPCVQYAGV